VSGKNRGSEALRKLQWTTIFDVGLCLGEKIGSEALTKLQWTTIFDVGLCVGEKYRDLRQRLWSTVASLRLHSLSFSPTHRPTSKIVVHCSFLKASLPIFFREALRKLQWTTIFDVGLCVGGKERE
jgi:hypothetical protein